MTEDPRTDEALIEAVNHGDFSAFEVIYKRHRDWVVRLAHRFTGNRDDALDVLQETFAYFLRKFPGFELRAKLTTFLYPAVKNNAIRARQKRGRHVSGEKIPLEAVAPEGAGTSREELRAALAVLGEGQLEVLLMRFVDGMTLAEIAEALGIPIGTVKSRLHSTLGTLREDARTRRYFEIE